MYLYAVQYLSFSQKTYSIYSVQLCWILDVCKIFIPMGWFSVTDDLSIIVKSNQRGKFVACLFEWCSIDDGLSSACALLLFQEGLGPFCFLIFLGDCLIIAVFVFIILPETKGKTVLQITEEFRKINRKRMGGSSVAIRRRVSQIVPEVFVIATKL